MLHSFAPALLRLLAAFAALLLAVPARAAVTITFWSHELGNSFPHAFFTLRGTLDSDGTPVDTNFGFTAITISPAILWGAVPGRIDIAKPAYMRGSDARFSLVIGDAQYADLLRLVDEWDPAKGDGTYHMNTRNCVTFVREAARRVGLVQVEFARLMKKPRSYLKAVAAANPAQVTVIGQHGKAHLAALPPLPPVTPPPVVATLPSPVPAR